MQSNSSEQSPEENSQSQSQSLELSESSTEKGNEFEKNDFHPEEVAHLPNQAVKDLNRLEVDYDTVNKLDIRDFEKDFIIPRDFNPKLYLNLFSVEEKNIVNPPPRSTPLDQQLHSMLKKVGVEMESLQEYVIKTDPM